jgi:hypothetical protein
MSVQAPHNSNLQWVGGSFDPSAFDLTDVNDRLASIKHEPQGGRN